MDLLSAVDAVDVSARRPPPPVEPELTDAQRAYRRYVIRCEFGMLDWSWRRYLLKHPAQVLQRLRARKGGSRSA